MTAITPTTLAEALVVIHDLAVALQEHRADMHNSSNRPCGTCRQSARALQAIGITPFVESSKMDRAQAVRDAAAWPSHSGSEATS